MIEADSSFQNLCNYYHPVAAIFFKMVKNAQLRILSSFTLMTKSSLKSYSKFKRQNNVNKSIIVKTECEAVVMQY